MKCTECKIENATIELRERGKPTYLCNKCLEPIIERCEAIIFSTLEKTEEEHAQTGTSQQGCGE